MSIHFFYTHKLNLFLENANKSINKMKGSLKSTLSPKPYILQFRLNFRKKNCKVKVTESEDWNFEVCLP